MESVEWGLLAARIQFAVTISFHIVLAAFSILHSLATTGSSGTLRCQYQDHLGQQRICRIASRAIVDQSVCTGFRGTCSDITDEVAAHAQIQHLSLHDALTRSA